MRAVQRQVLATVTAEPVDRFGPLTWEQAVDEFLTAQERLMREAATLRNHRWVLLGRAREFAEEKGLANVADWTEVVFESFLAELARLHDATGAVGLSASTISIHYRVTKQFLRWCARRGYLQDRSALDVEAPKGPDLLPRSIGPDATRRLLAVAKAGGAAAHATRDRGRDAVIVELMVRCGVRRCEVPLLSLDSLVQTSRGDWLLRVFGKGSKERMIPLDTARHQMSRVLREYVRHVRPRDTERRELFLGARQRDGGYQPLTASGVGQVVSRLSKRTAHHGPRVRVSCHMLRHEFATRTLEDGVTISELQRALGHTTPHMSLRYAKATDEDLVRAWRRRQG